MREQLLNRAVHGYGVVVGLGLVVNDDGNLVVEHGCVELTGGSPWTATGACSTGRAGTSGRPTSSASPRPAGHYTLAAHFAAHPPSIDDCFPFAGERAQRWAGGRGLHPATGVRAVNRAARSTRRARASAMTPTCAAGPAPGPARPLRRPGEPGRRLGARQAG